MSEPVGSQLAFSSQEYFTGFSGFGTLKENTSSEWLG
jgi:hypothetical protein